MIGHGKFWWMLDVLKAGEQLSLGQEVEKNRKSN